MPTQDLTEFIEHVTGESHLRVEDDLGDGFVVLKVSEAERRQARHDVRSTEDIVIEMLRNARDAHAKNIFLATSREGATRRLVMIDDGDGIPPHLHKRIFEARVTSKLDTMHIDTWGVHGRGMALYAVRMNSKQACVVASKKGDGSSILVETDTTLLPEKTDQSSMPVFTLSESGTIVVRGSRNINRTVSEFAYLNRDVCTVYLGTPVEIAATLWEFGSLLLPESTRAFCNDIEELGVCKRLAIASSPEELARIALSVGLDMSSRSARRIMDGDVSGVAPVTERIHIQGQGGAQHAVKRKRHTTRSPEDMVRVSQDKNIKLAAEDLADLKSSIHNAFASLAQAYYLEEDIDISLTPRKDTLHISIPLKRV